MALARHSAPHTAAARLRTFHHGTERDADPVLGHRAHPRHGGFLGCYLVLEPGFPRLPLALTAQLIVAETLFG